MALTELGGVAELSQETVSCFQHSGRSFALVYQAQQFYLLDDLCPHKAAALCDGRVRDNTLECPWHKARFDLATGRGLSPLAGDGVRSYRVSVEGDRVWADLDSDPT